MIPLFERILREGLDDVLIRSLSSINRWAGDYENKAVYIEPHQIVAINNRYKADENFNVYRKEQEGTGKVEYFAHFEKDPDEKKYFIVRCNRKYLHAVERIIYNVYGKRIKVDDNKRSYVDRMLETTIEPSASYFEHFDDDEDDLDLDYYKNDPQAVIVPFSYDQETGASFSCGEPFRVFGRRLDPLKQAYNVVSLGEEDRRIRAIAITDSNEKELKDVYTLDDDGEYYNEDGKLLNLTVVKDIGPTEFCTAVIDDWNVDTAPEYFA